MLSVVMRQIAGMEYDSIVLSRGFSGEILKEIDRRN